MSAHRFASALFLLVITGACASAPRQQPLTRSSLKGMATARVEASGTNLRVFQARDSTSPLAMLLGPGAEALADKVKDDSAAGRVKPQAGEALAVSVLQDHFVERLRAAGIFRRIDGTPPYPPSASTAETPPPSAQDQQVDGLVRLRIVDISLRTGRSVGSLRLQLGVHATMTRSGAAAPSWERHETVFADDEHPLAYYAEHGFPMLQPLATKVADRLADDIIYSR